LFRIDRNNVNLGARKQVWVDSSGGTEADALEETQTAAASAEYLAQIQAAEIIEAALREAKIQEEQILADARNEAAGIVALAIEEAEHARRKAFVEGYEKGEAEGRISYDETLNEKMAKDDEMLHSIIAQIHDERERTYSTLEDDVVGLALEIVRKVIAPAEEELGGVFKALIKSALKQISPEGKVIIHVSADEYDRFFSEGKSVFELDNGTKINATILRDASLGGGDLIIDTEQETVNAGINSQLKYIALAFEKMVL